MHVREARLRSARRGSAAIAANLDAALQATRGGLDGGAVGEGAGAHHRKVVVAHVHHVARARGAAASDLSQHR